MNVGPEEAWRIFETADEVCSAECVSAEVARMASEITAVLGTRHPLVLVLMRGGIIFAGHLLPQLRFPLQLDYLDLTRYGSATVGGEISWKVSPGTTVDGRAVLVLDDILDEGHTLAAVRAKLLQAGASDVLIAVFSEKDLGRSKPVKPDFLGITLPNRYVFGFGMDVRGAWRNLPAVYAVKDT
jgi:hypoxanthine phosphoribosyltransferase